MPRGDGTGPIGMGPRTGRKMGWCKSVFYSRDVFNVKRFGIIRSVIPVLAALIGDALNPNGIIRSIGNRHLIKQNSKNNRVIDADYTCIDEKR